MNGKSNFLLNIGITLTFGLYGIIGGLYSELQKDAMAQNGSTIALEIIGIFVVAGLVYWCFSEAYSEIEDDNRE